ncbi:hypothetical protein ACFL9T_19240 [Thermodesulfobacteriota bacterium]
MKRKFKKLQEFFSFLFIPNYDELSLFTTSYVCILLILVKNPPNSWNFEELTFSIEGFKTIFIFIPFIAGMLLCIYHAFSKRKKTSFEKLLMIFFAAIINGFSGIWGGTYMILNSEEWAFYIFPIWNITSGFLLLAMLRGPAIGEECISDENVAFSQVFVGTIIVSGIFYLGYSVFDLNWAVTFSICVAWSTNVNSAFDSLIFKERIRLTQA